MQINIFYQTFFGNKKVFPKNKLFINFMRDKHEYVRCLLTMRGSWIFQAKGRRAEIDLWKVFQKVLKNFCLRI